MAKKATHYPSLEDEVKFRKCKTYRHPFDPDDVIDASLVPFHREQNIYLKGNRRDYLLCPRCGTWRLDIISKATGELLDRQYKYPEGYDLVDTGLSLAERRLAIFRDRDSNARAARKALSAPSKAKVKKGLRRTV
jgi:hypothetical protein